jgi:hypothetical protein
MPFAAKVPEDKMRDWPEITFKMEPRLLARVDWIVANSPIPTTRNDMINALIFARLRSHGSI